MMHHAGRHDRLSIAIRQLRLAITCTKWISGEDVRNRLIQALRIHRLRGVVHLARGHAFPHQLLLAGIDQIHVDGAFAIAIHLVAPRVTGPAAIETAAIAVIRRKRRRLHAGLFLDPGVEIHEQVGIGRRIGIPPHLHLTLRRPLQTLGD